MENRSQRSDQQNLNQRAKNDEWLLTTCLPEIELAILRDKDLTKDAKQNLYRLMVTAYKEIVNSR